MTSDKTAQETSALFGITNDKTDQATSALFGRYEELRQLYGRRGYGREYDEALANAKGFEDGLIAGLGDDAWDIIRGAGGPFLNEEQDCVWCDGDGEHANCDQYGNEDGVTTRCDACRGTGKMIT